MKQLIIVSTEREIRPFIEISGLPNDIKLNDIVKIGENCDLLLTGVGAPSTIFCLTRALNNESYDRVIQVGVAGSFKKVITPGSLVEVRSDCFADLGIDDRGSFISLSEVGLDKDNQEVFSEGRILNQDLGITGLPLHDSISVNTVSGSEDLIQQRMELFNPDIETMEGAAAFYVCKMMKISVLQVRSISNYVEPRNRDAWELNLAISNLNKWLAEFVNAEEGK